MSALGYIYITFNSFLGFRNWGGVLKISEYILQNKKQRLNRIMFIGSLIVLIIFIIASIFVGNSLFATAVWTLPASILIASLYNIDTNVDNKFVNACVLFGDVTYEFFLIHTLVISNLFIILNKLDFKPTILTYGIAFIITFILAKGFHVILLKNKSLMKGAK